ncbi:hypothetical protein N9N67_04120 [Bacteriovoracaceae bacterium]|nr:hypothetical protein [Bacteriovoracaceae bacterium]
MKLIILLLSLSINTTLMAVNTFDQCQYFDHSRLGDKAVQSILSNPSLIVGSFDLGTQDNWQVTEEVVDANQTVKDWAIQRKIELKKIIEDVSITYNCRYFINTINDDVVLYLLYWRQNNGQFYELASLFSNPAEEGIERVFWQVNLKKEDMETTMANMLPLAKAVEGSQQNPAKIATLQTINQEIYDMDKLFESALSKADYDTASNVAKTQLRLAQEGLIIASELEDFYDRFDYYTLIANSNLELLTSLTEVKKNTFAQQIGKEIQQRNSQLSK